MEDEEAKRIQEERDKQLTEEYKERLNPKRPDEEIGLDLKAEITGVGFETSVNVATDALTTALGWAPPLYAVANFLSAGGANLVSQKMIRGKEDIDWGEAWASAGMGTIPFMSPAAGRLTKVVGNPNSIKRAVVGGGLTGVGYQQIQAGVNEGRVISPTEAALGFATGGVVSGGMQAGSEVLGKALLGNINARPVFADGPKLSTNEKLKQALIANDVIELPPTYPGGPVKIRTEADYFDVSAALIGGGVEDTLDAAGKPIPYNREKVTSFGGTKTLSSREKRDLVYNHIKNNLKRRKKDGTGTDITRKEFDQYAEEQIAAEKDLRKAIKIMNLKEYAYTKGMEFELETKYPTAESQLKFLDEINKAKHPPQRRKDRKTKEFTEDAESFEARTEIWKLETEPFQQYTDYKETFDYGHIISAKTGYRMGDLGMNRRSNTEIEPAYDVEFYDRHSKQLIEILQEGNRPRGSRREHLLAVQRMRGASSSVVEDYVKWKDMKDGNPVRLDKILDKFMPIDKQENPELHDKFLKFIQERFYEERKALGSIESFTKDLLGSSADFKNLSKSMQLKVRKKYNKEMPKWGNVIGQQQYDQGEEWIRNAIDDFIALPAQTKVKRKKNRSKKILEAIEKQETTDNPDLNALRNREVLLDMLNSPDFE